MMRTAAFAAFMALIFFNGIAHGGMVNFFDRDKVAQFLASNRCAAKTIDFRTTESGRILFWSMYDTHGHGSNEEFSFRLMKFDLARKAEEQLIGAKELKSFMSLKQLNNVQDISSDRDLNYVVLNAITPSNGKDPSSGLGSEIIIYDFRKHQVTTRIYDRKYHTNISMSDDGRHLAYFSHPDRFLLEPDPAKSPVFQGEVFDLKTSSSTVLVKANSGSSAGGDFIWREDSRMLVFFKRIPEGGNYPLMLFGWYPESGKLKSYNLTKNNRENINYLDFLPNGKIILNNPYEIFQFNGDLSFDRVIYEGKGINSMVVEKGKVHFRESYNKGGYGEKKQIGLN